MAKAKRSKPSWLGDGFATGKERNARVVDLMRDALQEAVANKDGAPPSYDDVLTELVDSLTKPLFDPLPRNSAAAEAAFVLTAFSLAEDRPLNLNPPSEDLTPGGRVSGDRTTSEGLSAILHGYHIPASKGALMSSTYRGGYRAKQARTSAVARYIDWACSPERTVGHLRQLFEALAWCFARLELAFPDLPTLHNAAFTFADTKALIQRLRVVHSQGAYEQYLVAALLDQEYGLIHPSYGVETKPVGATDTSTKTGADVRVTRRRTVVQAIEVSSSTWDLKFKQAGQAGAKTATRQVTIVAPASGVTPAMLAAQRKKDKVRSGVDIAVVDLDMFLDAVSARLTPAARAAAIRQVYDYLVTWGRTRPDLVQVLVDAVIDLELGSGTEAATEALRQTDALERLRTQVEFDNDKVVEVDRDDLAWVLEWVEGRIETDEGT